ncbi:MAG TPA: hypothetical protein DDZ68_03845 [Parvularcula sp.]|nr:hypothetical protein [Parvularcula sp.]
MKSPSFYEPAPVAASMAIVRPRAIAGAVERPEAQAKDGGAKLFCLPARNGGPLSLLGPPGEKSFRAAVAPQAIEAEPTRGEIKPSELRWAMGREMRRRVMATGAPHQSKRILREFAPMLAHAVQ